MLSRVKTTKNMNLAISVIVMTLSATSSFAQVQEEDRSPGHMVKNAASGALVAGGVTGVGAGAAAAATGGTAAVVHSSGALIATGAGGYVGGTLGTVGVTALGVASAPVWIVGGVVAAGAGVACYFWC